MVKTGKVKSAVNVVGSKLNVKLYFLPPPVSNYAVYSIPREQNSLLTSFDAESML